MKTFLLLGCAACLALAPQTTTAQVKQKPAVVVRVLAKTLEGKVAAINLQTGTLTITTTNKTQELIQCGQDCGFGDEEDNLTSLSELKKGEKVYVKCSEYNGQLTGIRVARIKPQKAKTRRK
jgi:hypothetical protein